MVVSDSSYRNLLAHLHRPDQSLPVDSLQAALSHHLAQVEAVTPLAAAALSSPAFHIHPTLQKLNSISTAFQDAVHLKFLALEAPTSFGANLFSFSLATRLRQWVSAVVKGLQGGMPLLRVAAYGGLLIGLENLHLHHQLLIGREKLENEMVVSLAEVMDTYRHTSDNASSHSLGWEQDWNKTFLVTDGVDPLSLALLLASKSLPLVTPEKLQTLPLLELHRMLITTVTSTFQSGRFLATLPSVASAAPGSQIIIPPESALVKALDTLSMSPLLHSIAPLSRLASTTLALLIQSHPLEGLKAADDTLLELLDLCQRLESDWQHSVLSSISDENTIALSTRPIAQSIWAHLKTCLFSVIMISQSLLEALVYVSPKEFVAADIRIKPASLSRLSLQTLSHLAFVIAQFGGLTGEGFKQLKMTFFLAVDIIVDSADNAGEELAHTLCLEARQYQRTHNLFDQAKKAYVLACIEQLVPVLNTRSIEYDIFPLCEPHLYDATNRGSFECAHSVMLAILSSNTQSESSPQATDTAFIQKLIVFYVKCLLQNIQSDRLNVNQLQLAFAALVRSASATSQGPLLAKFCIDTLLEAMKQPHDPGEMHRLQMMLIGSVSAVSLSLLPFILEEIKHQLNQSTPTPDASSTSQLALQQALTTALFTEVMENVGDKEKGFVMKWWNENWSSLNNLVPQTSGFETAERALL